jgi:hypothetical protein
MKKLAVIGRGTSGSLAVPHFLKYTDWEIDWYFDSSIKPQAVGEASWPQLPLDLYNTLDFTVFDLESIDGTFKTGVSKSNWAATGGKFFHHLIPGMVAYHLNAVKLQDFIINKVKNNNRVTIHDIKVTHHDSIDADFIFDCSGKPSDFIDYNILKFIPVNAVHVTMCFWDRPEFQYSLANATKYGWHFGLPLQNRCAVGYLYNQDFNTLDEVKADSLKVIEDLNLTPSAVTNSLNFKSYARKQNYTQRVAYCGNASFFLEPLEATSFWIGDKIQRSAFDIWHGTSSPEEENFKYIKTLHEAEVMIMLHYFAGSAFETPFWRFAESRGSDCIYRAIQHDDFREIIKLSFLPENYNMTTDILRNAPYSGWGATSFHQNIEGLGLKDKFREMLGIKN